MHTVPPTYVETSSLRMLRNVTRAHLRDHCPPLVILGDTGSGKSALLAKMALEFRSDFDCRLYQAQRHPTQTSPPQATRNPRWDTKKPPGINMHAIYQDLRNTIPKRPPLLLIDDADQLSVAELYALLHLKHAVDRTGKTRFSLILCGHPSLEHRLPELNPEASAQHISLRLRPLSRQEAEVFIDQQGYDLSKRQIDGLFRKTNGMPGALLEALVQTRGKQDSRFALLKRHLPISSIALFIVAMTTLLLVRPLT